MFDYNFYTYILTNKKHTVFYTGVTNNLIRRLGEHRLSTNPEGFTTKYRCTKLIYFEAGQDVYGAIAREKEIKGWRREKKIKLINSLNPEWRDLYEDFFESRGEILHKGSE
ncbi:MAG: GIY-YIG nuclease family protein [Candidatus Uhrbacteria bacterium]